MKGWSNIKTTNYIFLGGAILKLKMCNFISVLQPCHLYERVKSFKVLYRRLQKLRLLVKILRKEEFYFLLISA